MDAGHALARMKDVPPIRRLLVVVNPAAGRRRRERGGMKRLGQVVGARGTIAETPDLASMVASIAEARAAGVDTIAIHGGDGTNLHVLTAIANAWRGLPWPRIVLLAGGSVNTAARNLDADDDATRRLARLLATDAPGALRMPLLRVNGRVGFMFGSQVVARVLDAYYAGRTGPTGCVLLAARIVSSAVVGGRFARSLLEPEPVELEVDGEPIGTLAVRGLMACVVPAPAVGLRITPRAGEDGAFHLVATEQSPERLVRELPRLWAGLPVRSMAVDVLARHATLTFGRGGRYTLDGDLFAARKVQLSATEPVTILHP